MTDLQLGQRPHAGAISAVVGGVGAVQQQGETVCRRPPPQQGQAPGAGGTAPSGIGAALGDSVRSGGGLFRD